LIFFPKISDPISFPSPREIFIINAWAVMQSMASINCSTYALIATRFCLSMTEIKIDSKR